MTRLRILTAQYVAAVFGFLSSTIKAGVGPKRSTFPK